MLIDIDTTEHYFNLDRFLNKDNLHGAGREWKAGPSTRLQAGLIILVMI